VSDNSSPFFSSLPPCSIWALAKEKGEKKKKPDWVPALLFPFSPRSHVPWMERLCADWTFCVRLLKLTASLSSPAMRKLWGLGAGYFLHAMEGQCPNLGQLERYRIAQLPAPAHLLQARQALCSRKHQYHRVFSSQAQLSFPWTWEKATQGEQSHECPVAQAPGFTNTSSEVDFSNCSSQEECL
jgi:hypothetical protein